MVYYKCCVQTSIYMDMQGVVDVAIYGRIATLELFRPTVSSQNPRAGPLPVAVVVTIDWHGEKPQATFYAVLKLYDAAGRVQGSSVPLHRAMQVLRAGVQLRDR